MPRIMREPAPTEPLTKEEKRHRKAIEKLRLETEKKAQKIIKDEALKKEEAFIKEAALFGFNAKQAKFIYSQIMLNRDYYCQGRGSYVFSKS